MHYSVIYYMRGESLEDLSLSSIEEDFFDRFCYGCWEHHNPKYRYFCDWFQIGGRWCDILSASKGLLGERSWASEGEETPKGKFSIADISDLTEPIDKDYVYAIATRSRIYESDHERYAELLADINSKKAKGVVAVIDCHD